MTAPVAAARAVPMSGMAGGMSNLIDDFLEHVNASFVNVAGPRSGRAGDEKYTSGTFRGFNLPKRSYERLPAPSRQEH